MIIDKIENYKLYISLSENIAKAFDYILKTDLMTIPDGTYDIDEVGFAMVQTYNTKYQKDCKLEAHKKHIDVQYIISGVEQVGVASLTNQKQTAENNADDYAFYDGEYGIIKLERSMFAIFFPEDLHMPGLMLTQPANVKKLVVKVKI